MTAAAAPAPATSATLRERDARSHHHQRDRQQSGKRKFERNQFKPHNGPHFAFKQALALPQPSH
jgi:hypothetical protein